MEKPKYFIIMREGSNPLWKDYIEWLKTTYRETWVGSNDEYYGYDGNAKFNGTMFNKDIKDFINNPVILTLKQWKEMFIGKEFVLPKDWFLVVTEENIEKAGEWRKAMCTIKNVHYSSNIYIGCSLVSKHINDGSFYNYANLSKSKDYYYKKYKELTTEQFIKYVYNPKFEIMENKEDYVIKCLTPEHGEEIIQHFKDAGVDTRGYKGSVNDKKNNCSFYYKLIGGYFDNYSLSAVHLSNILIKELPKKELNMYSIKEIETNENLVVYLDSQEEWNKLNTITDRINNTCFNGQHCYNLYNRTWSNTSSKTDPGYYKNSTIITINQIKELNMEKEIIGYKLIKPEYKEAAFKICKVTSFSINTDYDFTASSFTCGELKKVGVLDLWFKPIYKEEEKVYNVGDWVVWFAGLQIVIGKIVKYNDDDGCYALDINGNLNSYNSCDKRYLRLATKEEIKKSQSKVYKLGIREIFEIVVRDKKAFYGSEDVTEGILELQNDNKLYGINKKYGKYIFTFKDVIISKSGCITKESYLSQWLAIDLI